MPNVITLLEQFLIKNVVFSFKLLFELATRASENATVSFKNVACPSNSKSNFKPADQVFVKFEIKF